MKYVLGMFLLPVTINQHSIGSLLAGSTFYIPALQRPYAWSSTQAIDLVNDLQEMQEAINQGQAAPSHFFGMVVTISIAGESSQIIDGQQRLTTITVLLSTIQHEFNRVAADIEKRLPKLPKHLQEHNQQVQAQCTTQANNIFNQLWVNKGLQGTKFVHEPRITVSPEIQSTYRALLDGKEDALSTKLPKPARNLLEVAAHFRKYLIKSAELKKLDPIEQYKSLDALLKIVEDGLIVARLDSTSAASGYDLFESLNARGVSLNELDLVKTWMLSQFAESNLPGTEVAAVMHQLSAGEIKDQRQFFRDFCHLRTLLTGVGADPNQLFKSSVNSIELSKHARKYVFKDPVLAEVGVGNITDKISDEVKIMATLSPIWENLHSGGGDRTPDAFKASNFGKEIRASLGYLLDSNGMKFQQFGPHLPMWADSLKDNPALFAELTSAFERFFFRYKSICGNTPAKVRDVLDKITKQAASPAGLSSTFISDTLNKFVNLDAGDKMFMSRLLEVLHYEKNPNLIRYFLYRLALTSWKPPYDSQSGHHLMHHDVGPNGERWTLEHIVPQNPSTALTLPDEELHSIGNLCLLNPSINTVLSNKSFAEKKEKAAEIKKQNWITVADSAAIFYGSEKSWGTNEIKQRESSLVNQALKVFSF